MQLEMTIGNAVITQHVAAVKTIWQSGRKDRWELGKEFSALRNAYKNYQKDNKGLSYSEIVRRTGVPRATAELYRKMYDTANNNDIPADAFLALADAGFDLSSDLSEQATVAGVLQAHPKLKDVEHIAGLSDQETQELVDGLKKNFGKSSDAHGTIATLQALKAGIEKMPDNPDKQQLLADTNKKIQKRMISALELLVRGVAPFIGRSDQWVKEYIEEVAESAVLTEQRYREAVNFAKAAPFLVPKKAAAKVSGKSKEEQA